MLNVATVFSGIGAAEHALDNLKIKYNLIFACDNGERKIKTKYEDILANVSGMNNKEKNKYVEKIYNDESTINYVEKTYKENFNIGEDIFFQDVRFIDGKEYTNQIDLFVGGSPCQSFSIMGKRKGLEEARGTLFYEFARLVDEIKPKVFIYENVYGMLNHDQGKTWEIISKIFDELGYKWTLWVLNAKDYNLPQNRRRIFVVGFLNEYENNFSVLEEPKKQELTYFMDELLESEVDNKYYLPEKGFNRVIDPKQIKHVALNGKIARCQVACQQYNWYGDMRFEKVIPKRLEEDSRIYKGIYKGDRGVARCLTPRECLRIMGFRDDFKISVPDQHMYRQVGNSIAINVIEAILKEIFKTGIFKECLNEE